MRTALALFFLLSAAKRIACQAPVTMPQTQLRTITSAANGQEYVLYVHLPAGYSEVKTYPVIYLLDAQWDFPLVTGIVESLTDDGFVPGVIIVGITWGGKDPDYGYLRFRDLTPANGARFPQSGKGPEFLRFIKTEVVPFVESNYRAAKTDRTLVGNSLGGLFALYALFAEPGLFTRYVVSSPTLGFAGGIAPYEQKYASGAPDLPVRLFLTVGEVEVPHIAQIREFTAALGARHYRSLELDTLIVTNAGHNSNKPEGFLRGLEAVFTPIPIAIDGAMLDRYVGTYQFAGYTEDVVKDNGRLYLVIPEGTRFLLNPTSDSDFYTRGVYSIVHFKPAGMEVEQWGGGRVFANKVR